MNNYFVNITKELNIPEFAVEKSLNISDPIDLIIHQYSKHPSVLIINEYVNTSEIFTFDKTIESQIEK